MADLIERVRLLEQKQARPHDELICELLDSRLPKTEREHAAAREIERLREALKDADNELNWLDEDMDTCDHSVGVCMCSYWGMRRKMKAALAKEVNND